MRRLVLNLFMVVFIFVLSVCLLPQQASAATEEGFTYSVKDGEATITGVDTSIEGTITIPATLGGYPVTGIGTNVFYEYVDLDEINFDGTRADFAKIQIAAGNEILYNTEINYTYGLPSEGLTYKYVELITNGNSTSLLDAYYVTGIGTCTDTDLVIPESYNGKKVRGITEGAFACNEDLTSVYIPSCVNYIYKNAFKNCSNLLWAEVHGSINDTNYLELKGYSVFSGCSSLQFFYTVDVEIKAGTVNGYTDYYPIGFWFGQSSFAGGTGCSQPYYDMNTATLKQKTFYFPTSLKTIQLGGFDFESYTGWGYTYAFSGCSTISKVMIKNGVTAIPNKSFLSMEGLECIVIPDSVLTIGNHAFYGCSRLCSVTIPGNITEIGNYAFANDTSLNVVTFNGNAPDMNSYSFKDVIATAYFPEDNASWTEEKMQNYGGTITWVSYCDHSYSIEAIKPTCTENGYTKYSCQNCGDTFVDNYVDALGHNYVDGICSNCGDKKILSSGACGDNLTYILYETGQLVISGTGAMTGYSSTTIPWYDQRTLISSVIVEDNITGIGSSAFSGCVNLTNITIPNSVTNIGNYAFRNCSSLTSITIPDGVTSIGYSAFNGCSSLESMTLPFVGNSINTTSDSKKYPLGYIFGTTSYEGGIETTQYYHRNEYGIYGTTYYIPSCLKSVTVTGGNLYCGAFYNCCNLETIIICNGINDIGESVFYGCSKLFSITIPDSVTTIGANAFYGCENLTSINLPEGINNIGEAAFFGCNSLTGIWVDENNTFYSCDKYGVLFDKEKTQLIQAPVILTGDYAIIDSVVCIRNNAFRNCSELTGITIPNSVTSIGEAAFYGCCKLTSIIIPNGVNKVGNGAFYGCNSLTSITIPNSVAYIGEWAFYECWNLTSITIPNGVTGIGMKAFSCCNNITSITIPNSVISIGDGAFGNCINLTSITIADGVNSIGDGAFGGCCNLTSVAIPSSVTLIYWNSFFGCSSLTGIWVDENNANYSSDEYGVLFNKNKSFLICAPDKLSGDYVIPNSVTGMEWRAFRNCSNITSVAIPNGVTRIYEYTFSGCDSLTDVYYCGTPEQWNSIQIDSNNDSLLNATLNYHNHSDSVVVVEPTFTTAGQEQIICSFCGDTVTETIDILEGKVSQWNIVLEDDYAVNFYLQVSESIESTAKVRLTIGNDTVTYSVSALEKTDDGYFRLTANISAAQMNDFITVMVMNGREIGCNNTYTAWQYCNTILADPKHSTYHGLVREMLNYGAMAQVYFGYDTENLANEGITGTAATDIPEIAEDLTVTDKISDLSFYGASLVYRDRIAVRYYFTGDVTGCAFSANGNTYTPVSKDGMYYIEIADILPQNLDQQITLTVTDASGNTLTVTYGPMNYIVRMNAKGNDNLKNLLKALYNYHLAAESFQSV